MRTFSDFNEYNQNYQEQNSFIIFKKNLKIKRTNFRAQIGHYSDNLGVKIVFIN